MATTAQVDLQRLAEEELLREASAAAIRAESRGHWQYPLLRTNKVFLKNTVISTVSFNTRRNAKKAKKSQKVKNPYAITFTKKKKKSLANNTFTVKSSSKPVNPKPMEKPTAKK